jgi:hypothetical protein
MPGVVEIPERVEEATARQRDRTIKALEKGMPHLPLPAAGWAGRLRPRRGATQTYYGLRAIFEGAGQESSVTAGWRRPTCTT